MSVEGWHQVYLLSVGKESTSFVHSYDLIPLLLSLSLLDFQVTCFISHVIIRASPTAKTSPGSSSHHTADHGRLDYALLHGT